MEETHLAAETLFQVGPLPITNTLLVTWIVMLGLVLSSYFITKNLKKFPSGWQNFAEAAIEQIYNLIESLAGKNAIRFFPFIATFFIFILLANLIGLLPGFGTIGISQTQNGHVKFLPFFRSVNSDLNTTLALAVISAFATHIFAIKLTGIKYYLKRFFSFNPIYLFVGLLEIVSEITKIISLSFRLFGNIFAGEALLVTISALFAFIVPLPFMALEIVMALVQAMVFAMLTLVFMTILSTKETH
jgi:F-type H+-transporting ATPase subunit a